MKNILPIVVVVLIISLLTSKVISPSPTTVVTDEVIVKDGHRVVVVEYDKEADGNTKVSFSPNDVVVPSNREIKQSKGKFSGSKDLVCDAYGKCTHKIANAFGKTKDMVTETVHEVSEKANRIEERVTEAVGKSRQESEEKASRNPVGESLARAKDAVVGKAKQLAGDTIEIVKDCVSKDFDVVDSPKRLGEDIARNASVKIGESAEHVNEEAKETVQEVGKKSLNEIVRKLKEVAYEVIRYEVIRYVSYCDEMDSVVGFIHMLGFSAAYGMCVWVTFVSSYILGRHLPRQLYGMVQSRLHLVYFKAMAYCVSAVLLGHLASQKSEILTSKMGMFQVLCLVSALLLVLANMMLLEPKATKVMYERMKIEKEEGRGVGVGVARKDSGEIDRMVDRTLGGGNTTLKATTSAVAERRDVLRLNEKLKRLNGYSSALNLSTLVVLTWHMAYMGQLLQTAR